MPTPNVELLQQTLAHIKANPREWNQDVYRDASPCGTAMCFAGWSVTLAGGQWADARGDYLKATDEDRPGHIVDGVVHAAYRARRLLGLTVEQSEDLFHACNNLRYLEDAVAELCAQAADEVDHVEPKTTGR